MSDESYMDEIARRLREQIQRMQEQGGENPLMEFLAAFLGFFLSVDNNEDAPTLDDIDDPAARARAERGSRDRERSERQRYGDFRQSAGRWTAVDVASSSAELVEMRRTLEAANGGQRIEAINPVEGPYRITSGYGMRVHPRTGVNRMHAGVDFAGENPGDMPNIVAAMPGVVVGVGARSGYGNTIEILDIYGVRHRYAHLDSSAVSVGQRVEQGDVIGVMGTTGLSTGVHLHYEQRDSQDRHRPPLQHLNLDGRPVRSSDATAPAPAARPQPAAPTPERAETPEAPERPQGPSIRTVSLPGVPVPVPVPTGLPRIELSEVRESAERMAGDAIRDVQSRLAGIGLRFGRG